MIHADLPASEAALTHRSGRTGRAGRQGRAILVVAHPQRRRAEGLIGRAGIVIAWVAAPGPEAILARDEARMLAEVVLDDVAILAAERETAARMLAHVDPQRLAVAYLRLYARVRPAPEVLIGGRSGDFARLARRQIGDGVWFTLNRGRAEKAEARWLLPLICRVGHVARKDIGCVVIGARETWFEIAGAAEATFVAALAHASEAGVEIRPHPGPEPALGRGGADLTPDDFPDGS